MGFFFYLSNRGIFINPCRAGYFYVLHSSITYTQLPCSIPFKHVFSILEKEGVDHDPMASSEVSGSGSIIYSPVFSKKKRINPGSAGQGLIFVN